MSKVALFPARTFALRTFLAVQAELKRHKQRDLARAMNVSEARISQIINGQTMTLDMAQRLLLVVEKLDRAAARDEAA